MSRLKPQSATWGWKTLGDQGVGVTPDVLLQEQKSQPNLTSPKTAPPRERSCVEVPFDATHQSKLHGP
jgi:hypothetical protein